jgi:transcription-repair coupling factor
MELPKLSPGKRFTLPRPLGSADSLLLARLAERDKAGGRTTAIVTADATDAQRLIDEMAFFAPALRCALFPDWETLPYDTFSPHQDLISERLATLWRISQGEADVVLVPATTALYRLAPPSFLAGYTFHFKVKQKLDEAKFKAQLTLAGYSHVSQVVSPGEYAVRGGLIDLFPMGSLVPFRVDLFDDEIDSIRTFDPDSQRSLYPVPEVRLLPGREFPMDDEARAKFRSRWREMLEGDPTKSRIYKDMGAGVATAGIEYYLPLFFDDTATVFDYLGGEATVVLHGDLEPAFQRFWQDTKDRFRLIQGDLSAPRCHPSRCSSPWTSSTRAPTCTRNCRCAQVCRMWMTTRTFRTWVTCRWCAGPRTRWPACTRTSATRNTACCCWPKAMAGERVCSTSCAPAG